MSYQHVELLPFQASFYTTFLKNSCRWYGLCTATRLKDRGCGRWGHAPCTKIVVDGMVWYATRHKDRGCGRWGHAPCTKIVVDGTVRYGMPHVLKTVVAADWGMLHVQYLYSNKSWLWHINYMEIIRLPQTSKPGHPHLGGCHNIQNNRISPFSLYIYRYK